MPIYEYRCEQCARRFSVFWRSFADVDETKVYCKRWGATKYTDWCRGAGGQIRGQPPRGYG